MRVKRVTMRKSNPTLRTNLISIFTRTLCGRWQMAWGEAWYMAVTVMLIALKHQIKGVSNLQNCKRSQVLLKEETLGTHCLQCWEAKFKEPCGENKREHIISLLLPVSLPLKMQCMLCYRHLWRLIIWQVLSALDVFHGACSLITM